MFKKNLLGITDHELVEGLRREQYLPEWKKSLTASFWREYNNYGFKYLRKKYSQLSEEDCDDFSSHAAEKVYTKVLDGSYQVRPQGLLQSYYIRICINLANDHFTRQKKNGSPLLSDDILEDVALAEEDQLQWQVEEMLRELETMSTSSECMTLIYDKYLHGKSHEELAKERDINVQSSKTKLSRCLERLRKAIRASKNNYLKNFIKK